MINEKKAFNNLNADDSVRFLGENEYLNMENMRLGVNEFGYQGTLQNIPSTQLLDTIALPSGTNLTIGRVSDISGNRLFRFNYNSEGENGIYCQDLSAGVTYIVLLSSQVDGGLNFLPAYRVDRNARIISNLLFWTDNNNEPRCINIERGIKLNQPGYITYITPYATPIPETDITIIVKPPVYQLEVEKIADGGFTNNFTSNDAFQFYYFYQYRDYQESANSVISDLIPFNFEDDTYNSVKIQIPFDEHIEDYVLAINLVVRFGNKGKSFLIYTWNKDIAYDAIAIASHNAGAVQLYYFFYNNKVGAALSDIQANTPFHGVALKAKTLEIAKNRVFLGDVLKGYNSPLITSLTLTAEAATTTEICVKSGSSYVGSVTFFDRYKRPCGRVPLGAVLTIPYRTRTQTTFVPAMDWTLSNTNALTEIPDSLYYYQICLSLNQARSFYVQTLAQDITYVQRTDTGEIVNIGVVYDNANTYAISVNIGSLLAVGEGYVFSDGDYATLQTQYNEETLRVLGQDGNNVWLTPKEFLLAYSRYFYESDSASNVWDDPNSYYFILDYVSSENPSASITPSSVATVGATGDIDNTDNHPVMTFTIPSVIDTRFQINVAINFKAGNIGDNPYSMQIRAVATHPTLTNVDIEVYGKVNAVSGEIYDDKGFGVITIPAGYEKLFIYTNLAGAHTHIFNISIAITSVVDINSLIEIFTPYKPSDNDPFFGVGEIMPITNPTTISRQYSVLSGTIEGDSYIIDRTVTIDDVDYDFKVESMSPNDNVWQRWERNLGWPSFIDRVGQQLKETSIDWSDTYINGTKTNGLNNFEPLNTKDIGSSSGSIQKLQLTSKQQEDGTVMLVVTDADSLSAYLQEVQLYKAATVEGLITTDAVIGTINPHQNGRGTLNPESVVEYNGVAWWWDVVHGVVAQYAQDGITTVSDNKLVRFADRWSKRYMALGRAAVEALCGFSYIDSCVDASTDEVFFCLPQVEENVFVSILPSYARRGVWKYTTLFYDAGSGTEEIIIYYVWLEEDGSSYYPSIYQNPNDLPFEVNFNKIDIVGFSEDALIEYILNFTSPPSGTWLPGQTPVFNWTDPLEWVELFVADYATSVQNRFDIYDGQPKIISYKFFQNVWQGCYLWLPDCMDYLGNRLVGYKNGQAWLFNEDNTSFNSIFGVQYPQRICLTANANPSLIRDVMQLAIEGNFIPPTFTVVYSDSPYVQITDLVDTDYVNDESVLDVTVLRDRLSPNATGTADEKLYTGDVVKSAYPLLMMEFTTYDYALAINMLNIGFAVSRGHNNILQKPTKTKE